MDITQSIQKALEFLYHNQLDDGEFKTYACRDVNMYDCEFDSSPFVTTFALYALEGIEDDKVKIITQKAIKFLLSEQEQGGIWRYWTSKNPKTLPPDLDDISTISFVLQRHHVSFDDNLALINRNRNGDNLFLTWLGTEFENDIDCVVNTNVLLYLGENDPAVCAYINAMIREDKFSSRYYLDKLSFFYTISRAFNQNIRCLGKNRKLIIDQVRRSQKQDGSFGNDLETALALNTLLNFDYNGDEIVSGIERLLQHQDRGGFWNREAFFSGYAPYYGSEELTTAIVIEAFKKIH